MTYKNIKFEDSAIMRSLEKLAVKKGLIEPEAMKKEASAKVAPYAPSENLGQNILKLCSGLRERGLGKYAAEVENKFMALKTAESMVFNSMLGDAHSEGSHDLKDMEGDATIEDLEDAHKKIQEIVNKTPKGKFAVRDALNLVKITLAQDAAEAEETEDDEEEETVPALVGTHDEVLQANWTKARDLFIDMDAIISQQGDMGVLGRRGIYTSYSDRLKEKLSEAPNMDNITRALSLIKAVKDTVKPGEISWQSVNPWGGVSLQAWSQVEKKFGYLADLVNACLQAINKINNPSRVAVTKKTPNKKKLNPKVPAGTSKRVGVTTRVPDQVIQFTQHLNTQISSLGTWLKTISTKRGLDVNEKSSATKWLNEQLADLNNLKSSLDGLMDPNQQLVFVNKSFNDLLQITKENRDFELQWLPDGQV